MMMNENVSKILTERHAWAERSLQIIEMKYAWKNQKLPPKRFGLDNGKSKHQ